MKAGTLVPGSASHRIHELLELDGGWMSLHQVEAEFASRWPATTQNTINRAFFRLAATDRVAKRRVDDVLGRGWCRVSHFTELRTT